MEREFYLRMAKRMGWSKRVLVHQIENQTYEATLLSQNNFEETLPEPIRHQAKLAVIGIILCKIESYVSYRKS